jgi:hypothetical protein
VHGGTEHRRRRSRLIIKKEQLQALQLRYSPGARIELVRMDDPAALPLGTRGTVAGIDDIGDIIVGWDNGSSLNVVPEVDRIRKIS